MPTTTHLYTTELPDGTSITARYRFITWDEWHAGAYAPEQLCDIEFDEIFLNGKEISHAKLEALHNLNLLSTLFRLHG